MTATIYPATDRAWLDIDLEAVRHNVRQLRLRAGVPLIVMVKANAYGVGAVLVSQALGVPFDRTPAAPEAPWGLGIASLDEAAELRDAGCRGRMCVSIPIATCWPLRPCWPSRAPSGS